MTLILTSELFLYFRSKGDKQLALPSQTTLARPYGYAENVNVKEVDKKEADSQLIVKVI
jgi:hypothetical protein